MEDRGGVFLRGGEERGNSMFKLKGGVAVAAGGGGGYEYGYGFWGW